MGNSGVFTVPVALFLPIGGAVFFDPAGLILQPLYYDYISFVPEGGEQDRQTNTQGVHTQ